MPIKLGDGICNPECNFASCAYDNGDCGKCASGCFENMINNGVCDPNCNIFDCGYDGNDCLSCAPGCLN